MLRKILLVCISVLLLVICDLSLKKIAREELKGQPMQVYLGGSLKLIYAENSAGMLSLGNKLPERVRLIIFQIYVPVVLVLLFAYTFFKKGTGLLDMVALILFLSGGSGNLISRLTNNGRVIDFMVIEIFNYSTGIFNLADIYITIGVIVFIISNVSFKKYYAQPAP